MRYLWLALLVAGCTSFSVLDEELPKYKGKPIDSLVAKLGFPNAEQTIMGRKVYVWSTSMSYVSVNPTTSTTTGYVGGRPITATSTSYTYSDSNLSCTLRAIVDAQGLIERYAYEGNNGACYTYSDRLR